MQKTFYGFFFIIRVKKIKCNINFIFADSDGEYTVIKKEPVKDVQPPQVEYLDVSITLTDENGSKCDITHLPLLHDAIIVTEDVIECDPNLTEYPRSLFEFDWKPLLNSQPLKQEEFRGPTPGPTKNLPTPYEAFVEIWDQSIMQHIADQTNIYARQSNAAHSWKDTDVDELYIYFSILISFGLCIKANIKEYFYDISDLTDTPNFKKYMTYDRYISLSNCLHFANNVDLDTKSLSSAKCFKIEPIIKHLNKKFSALYNLHSKIAIVESFLKVKSHNTDLITVEETDSEGLKTFELCDMTGYLWRVETYSKECHIGETLAESSPMTGPRPNLVLKFMKGLHNRGHTLFMDAFFNSPALARLLKATGTDCVGTLCTNREFVPKELNGYQKKLTKEFVVPDQTSGDVNIIIWRDKNRIAFISTYHDNSVAEQTNPMEEIQKPTVVQDYINNVSEVDKRDNFLASFRMEPGKIKIWYKKVFRHLFHVSLFNSWILHKSTPEVVVSSHRQFRFDIVNAILKKHYKAPKIATVIEPILESSCPTRSGSHTVFSEAALDHFPREYEFCPPPREQERIRKLCTMCSAPVHTYCQGCQVTLCAFTCHILYHQEDKKI